MGTTSRHSPSLRRRQDDARAGSWQLLAESFGRWQQQGAAQAGAALAFHASCAVGSALLAMLAIAALAGAEPAVVFVPQLAGLVHPLLAAAARHPQTALAAGLGAAGALLAGAAAFAQLRRALNSLHDGPALPTMTAPGAGRRWAGFLLVMGTGGLLTISLVLGTGLASYASLHGGPSGTLRGLARLADLGVSTIFWLPALAALLRWLPDTPSAPGAAWKGAAAAGVPIVLGKVVLAAWIAGADLASPYGAASAALLTMLWLFGASLLLLFGGAVAACADAGVQRTRARHLGARPLRAPPERSAANTPIPLAPPTSLAAARSRLRPPAGRRPADERRRGPGVLLQFPTTRRAPPPS